VRHHETRRPDQVRGDLEQHLALGERFGHQSEFIELEIAQAAVNQLRGRGRSRAGEVVFLHHQH
jgi:hypothetical protein